MKKRILTLFIHEVLEAEVHTILEEVTTKTPNNEDIKLKILAILIGDLLIVHTVLKISIILKEAIMKIHNKEDLENYLTFKETISKVNTISKGEVMKM